MGPPPGKPDDRALAALFVASFEESGFYWVVCRFCPVRQLCNPRYAPPLCAFCKVALIAERPPAVVN